MSRRTTAFLLGAAAWLVSGCGLSLDLDPHPPDQRMDATGPPPTRDAGADAGSDMDAAPPLDASGPLRDASGPRDADPADGPTLTGLDGAMCLEPDIILVDDCTRAVPAPGTDSDGDALPDTADPFPGTCNALVARQEMGGSASEWTEIRTWVYTCGKASSADASFTRTSPLALPDAYFAEATFTLGAATRGLWAVGLQVGLSETTAEAASCYIVSDMGGVVRLVGTGAPATHLGLVPTIDGTTITLQAWREGGTLTCRFFAGGAPQSFTLDIGIPTAVGTVRFGTSGRTVAIDYVRVFSL